MERPPNPPPATRVELFIPSETGDGDPVDQKIWCENALGMLGRLFGGATALPVGRGVWRDDEAEGELLFEDTQVVFCLARKDHLDAQGDRVIDWLKEMGKQTRQRAVGLVINGEYYEFRTDREA